MYSQMFVWLMENCAKQSWKRVKCRYFYNSLSLYRSNPPWLCEQLADNHRWQSTMNSYWKIDFGLLAQMPQSSFQNPDSVNNDTTSDASRDPDQNINHKATAEWIETPST